ncbi:MAG: phage portal protein [Beijerinckiaceae bacterium]
MFERVKQWWQRPNQGVEAKSLAAPEPWLLTLFGAAETAAGVSVTPATAMQATPVAAAVALIAGTVGTLPAKVFAKLENGKEADDQHPAYALVHDDANEWTSAARFREILTTDALLHGNGFAFLNKVNGQPREFIRLDPAQTACLIDTRTGEPVFETTGTTGKRRYNFRDVLHIPAFSLDGTSGVSPIHLAREAIALSIVLESHANKLFKNGARPSGVLRFPNKLGDAALKRLRDSWNAAHTGDNTGKTAVLEDSGDFKTLTFSSVDAQFAEMRAFQIYEIARAFRVPPHMLFEMGRATWSNSEEMRQHFLQFTLLPWLRTWEAAYRRVLLTPEEAKSYSVEFIVDDLLRADTGTRAEAYSKFVAMRAMTPNEVRARENMPAIEGGDTLANPYTTSNNDTPPKEAAA